MPTIYLFFAYKFSALPRYYNAGTEVMGTPSLNGNEVLKRIHYFCSSIFGPIASVHVY